MGADGDRGTARSRRVEAEASEPTYHRWRNQFGGIKAEEMKRVKELEKENVQLKRITLEQALDNRMLKDLAEGKF